MEGVNLIVDQLTHSKDDVFLSISQVVESSRVPKFKLVLMEIALVGGMATVFCDNFDGFRLKHLSGAKL